MRRLFSILLMLLCFISISQIHAKEMTSTLKIDLNKKWEFCSPQKKQWREVDIPSTVQQDLRKYNLLPDPFYGKNEEKVQWVEEQDWEYRKIFQVTPDMLLNDEALLTFEGLDTYADIYLNGALLERTDNMFLAHSFKVKELLKVGENNIRIFFHSPMKMARPQGESNGFVYPADNDHQEERLSVYTRKAPYSYGWDWGIRLVTMGVWRPVSLSFYNVTRIKDFYVEQTQVNADKAHLLNQISLESVDISSKKAEVVLTTTFENKEISRSTKEITLSKENLVVDFPLTITKPELWMPNGWGKPNLYNFDIDVKVDGKVVAHRSKKIGLRSIKVVSEKDKYGISFYFEVNGKRMFAKGANYIPSDANLTAVTSERYQKLFEDVKSANMNLLRVWGGGIYENDEFYDLADENGILIWQDFMFACTTYPGSPNFLKNVEKEAEYNIKRLRSHACLAMWCGNNEINEAWKHWGWQKKYDKEVYNKMKVDYDQLFIKLLPQMISKFDSNRFYMHTSPRYANWGDATSWNKGDSHYWGVWYGKQPFEILDKNLPRFMSEYGFQSFPEMKTLATIASPDDYHIESEVMNAHQKSSIGNATIKTYMERDYKVPSSFEDFVYVGLVLQGRGMRHGMEAHRRNRPYCEGTLYWQLNDSWPVVSWSSIDYYGNWKALHYQAKRAFNPVLINPIIEDGKLNCYILSDLLEKNDKSTLKLKLVNFEGKTLKKEKLKVNVPANKNLLACSINPSEWLTSTSKKDCLLELTLDDKHGKELDSQLFYFAKPKDLNLPKVSLKHKLRVKEGYCEVVLKSKTLVKDLFVEIPIQGARFSDNFFDLLPNQEYKIKISSDKIKKGMDIKLKFNHLRLTY